MQNQLRAISPTLNRAWLEAVIEAAIGLLDAIDGDADAEELDLDDGFAFSRLAIEWAGSAPGCRFSDEDEGAWVEWHALSDAHKGDPCRTCGPEDGEDDDPGGAMDEDGFNTGPGLLFAHGAAALEGPGCPIADPGGEASPYFRD